MTPSGVPISRRMGGVIRMPTAVSRALSTNPSATAVCTALRVFSALPAPMWRAMMIPRAGGKARHEADEQVHVGGGGGHCRQGVRVQKIAHDQRVHRVIELLEKISAQDGQGEAQDPAPRAAFRHQIELRHAVPPLYFKKARHPAMGCPRLV